MQRKTAMSPTQAFLVHTQVGSLASEFDWTNCCVTSSVRSPWLQWSTTSLSFLLVFPLLHVWAFHSFLCLGLTCLSDPFCLTECVSSILLILSVRSCSMLTGALQSPFLPFIGPNRYHPFHTPGALETPANEWPGGHIHAQWESLIMDIFCKISGLCIHVILLINANDMILSEWAEFAIFS